MRINLWHYRWNFVHSGDETDVNKESSLRGKILSATSAMDARPIGETSAR